jgi:CBS domain-containing protein
MDGGRVLRALLALGMNYAHATRIAARVGQFVAIAFAIWGLMGGGPMLLLIAFFVWIGAESEAAMVEERLALQGVSVREAMLTDYRTLAPHDSLGHAAELLLAGSQTDFPVLNDGQLMGVLSRSNLMEGLRQGGPAARVGEFLRQRLGSVEASAPLVPTLTRLREGEGPCLQVTDSGRPVGLLTLENIGEFLMVRAALDARAGRPAPAAGPLSS